MCRLGLPHPASAGRVNADRKTPRREAARSDPVLYGSRDRHSRVPKEPGNPDRIMGKY